MNETKRLISIAAIVMLGVLVSAYFSSRRDAVILPSDAFISGESTGDVFRSCNRIAAVLPLDARGRLAGIRLEYIAAYGVPHTCDRLRGRTVQQVFDEYEPTNVQPLESGEVDGVQWSLYAAPDDVGGVDLDTNSTPEGDSETSDTRLD